MIANTPKPPYYSVIFTSVKSNNNLGYDKMADSMEVLAKQQEGFLGMESARKKVGITVSYWDSVEAIKKWKINAAHIEAQEKGRSVWYKNFKVRICKVERDYEF